MTDPKLEAVRASNVSRFDFVTRPGGAAMMPGTAYVWAKDYDTLERRLQEAHDMCDRYAKQLQESRVDLEPDSSREEETTPEVGEHEFLAYVNDSVMRRLEFKVVHSGVARSLERRLKEWRRERDEYFERSATLRIERDAALREVEEMRKWLDNNTTWCPAYDPPVLAATSERLWYHATNDTQSYPFTAVIDAALAKKGKP